MFRAAGINSVFVVVLFATIGLAFCITSLVIQSLRGTPEVTPQSWPEIVGNDSWVEDQADCWCEKSLSIPLWKHFRNVNEEIKKRYGNFKKNQKYSNEELFIERSINDRPHGQLSPGTEDLTNSTPGSFMTNALDMESACNYFNSSLVKEIYYSPATEYHCQSGVVFRLYNQPWRMDMDRLEAVYRIMTNPSEMVVTQGRLNYGFRQKIRARKSIRHVSHSLVYIMGMALGNLHNVRMDWFKTERCNLNSPYMLNNLFGTDMFCLHSWNLNPEKIRNNTRLTLQFLNVTKTEASQYVEKMELHFFRNHTPDYFSHNNLSIFDLAVSRTPRKRYYRQFTLSDVKQKLGLLNLEKAGFGYRSYDIASLVIRHFPGEIVSIVRKKKCSLTYGLLEGYLRYEQLRTTPEINNSKIVRVRDITRSDIYNEVIHILPYAILRFMIYDGPSQSMAFIFHEISILLEY